MLPERLKEIYRSPKSTLVGILAALSGVIFYITLISDQGLDSLDPAALVAEGSLLVTMIYNFFQSD